MTMRNAPITHDEFTIAVVFAMSFELVPFLYMLDEEYKNSLPMKKGGDENYYRFGRLGPHKVVLASLAFEQGIGAAATVASDLDRSFPRIQWRLLVGIGGGVVSERHDIRLGDVVISTPDRGNPHGGVVQYDLGKQIGSHFQRKGLLAQPPRYLRGAAERMREDRYAQDNKIVEFVEGMMDKFPRLRTEYKRPDPSTDTLFPGDVPHKKGAACENCDTSQIVQRGPRPDSMPRIHYGLIASGNRVVVSVTDRENIIRSVDGDILCFEMEAAGLTAAKGCLVIRGISDYADPHKNRGWQHWAAANAAACAKELLLLVQPEEVNIGPAVPASNTANASTDGEGPSGLSLQEIQQKLANAQKNLKEKERQLAELEKLVVPRERAQCGSFSARDRVWSGGESCFARITEVFPQRYANPPKLMFGLSTMEAEADRNRCMGVEFPMTQNGSFSVQATAFNGTWAYAIGCNWMTLPTDLHLETGMIDTWTTGESNSEKIRRQVFFSQAFKSPPIVCVWMQLFEWTGNNFMSIKCSATEINADSFICQVESWAGRRFGNIKVQYMAYPSEENGKRVKSGTTTVTRAQGRVDFDFPFYGDPFKTEPASFIAICETDFHRGRNTRFTTSAVATKNGLKWNAGTWADTDMDHASVQWIAIE